MTAIIVYVWTYSFPDRVGYAASVAAFPTTEEANAWALAYMQRTGFSVALGYGVV